LGRVVFGKDLEPSKWFRLDSLLRDISAHRPADPSVVPDGPAINRQDSGSDKSSVVALVSQPDIFQPRLRVAFTSPTTSELLGAFIARADF
jgi:hypothetical protein